MSAGNEYGAACVSSLKKNVKKQKVKTNLAVCLHFWNAKVVCLTESKDAINFSMACKASHLKHLCNVCQRSNLTPITIYGRLIHYAIAKSRFKRQSKTV